MTPLSSSPALNELARQCRAEGWRVEMTAGNHLRWTAPNGQFVEVDTNGDQRSYRNHIGLLKRAWPEWRARQKRDRERPRRQRPKRRALKAAKLLFGPSPPYVQPIPSKPPTLADIWPNAGEQEK